MKESTRRQLLFIRKNLKNQYVLQSNKLIREKVLNLDEFKKSKIIMLYVSTKKEVDTHDLIKICLDIKTVAVPKTKAANRDLIPCLVSSFGHLTLGKFGILEPKIIRKIEKDKIDLFLVPGLGFDKNGNRIGFGYGYWDRFLKGVNKNRIIGLCFEKQMTRQIIPEPHDIQVSKIVTEKRIINCLCQK